MVNFKKWLYTMQPYAPPLEGRSRKTCLDFNESTRGAGKKIAKAIQGITAERLGIYPEYGAINQTIAKYAGIKENEVLFTNGSDEGIKLVFDCVINPGDEVILIQPTYAMFKLYAQASGAAIKEILYNSDLSFPLDRVLKAMRKKTKLVIVCSPNNPTGTSVSNKEICSLLEKNPACTVFIDEAYYEFKKKKESAVSLIDVFSNLVVTRTFSKAFGLAALRAGYLVCNTTDMNIFRKAYSPYAVNQLACVAVNTALANTKDMTAYVEEVLKEKNRVKQQLENLGMRVFSGDANFLLVYTGSSTTFFVRELAEKGILVRDRSKDALLAGVLRVSIGERDKNEKFLSVFKALMKKPLLIFDIDGVLINVSKSYRMAIKKTVAFFTGKNVSLTEIQDWKNKTGINNDWKLTKAILEKEGNRVSFEEVKKVFQEYYLGENWNGLIGQESFVMKKKLLRSLMAEQYRLAILTGRPRDEALFALQKAGVKDFFLEIIALEDVPEGKEKPDPYGLNLIKKRMNTVTGFYFGDSISDMKAALASEIEPIGVIPDTAFVQETATALKKAGARIVLNSINEIRRVLK